MTLDSAHISLLVNAVMSFTGFVVVISLIPKLGDMFIRGNLFGIDQSKAKRLKIPELMGFVCGTVFLIVMFLFIPVPFYKALSEQDGQFPHHGYVEYITAE